MSEFTDRCLPTEKQYHFFRMVLTDEIEALSDDQVIKIVEVIAFGNRGEAKRLIGGIKRWMESSRSVRIRNANNEGGK